MISNNVLCGPVRFSSLFPLFVSPSPMLFLASCNATHWNHSHSQNMSYSVSVRLSHTNVFFAPRFFLPLLTNIFYMVSYLRLLLPQKGFHRTMYFRAIIPLYYFTLITIISILNCNLYSGKIMSPFTSPIFFLALVSLFST